MSVTRLQFPPQLGKYAIKVKEGDRWYSFDTIRLEISVGQPYHEGEKFSCTIDWAKARFKNIVILCNDTLQRYNFSLNSDQNPEAYTQETREDGLLWVERNKNSLRGTNVIHWDHWLNHQDFLDTLQSAKNEYSQNKKFRAAVTESISSVFDRRLKRGLVTQNQSSRFFSLSYDYLMEETACLALAYKTYPGISAYPGSFLEMWRMFVDQPIAEPLRGLSNAHCLRIDFDRKTRTAPISSFGGHMAASIPS